MNYGAVANILGKLFIIIGALMLLPLGVSFIYGETGQLALLIPTLLLFLLGTIMSVKKARSRDVYIGEGFLIVTLAWIAMSVFGAMPFVISGAIPSPVDALFEMVSGFTTTGSTILTQVEILPHSLLFWRSFSHWIGGMGVLVFMLAITSNKDTKTMYIMRAETPGPTADKLVSKTKFSAQILYLIYIALTLIEFVLLLFGGMPVFDAITTAFATAGTGGFGVRNANIAAYNSAYCEYVIAVFMLLFGTNFGLFFLLLRGKFRDFFKNEEFRCYIGVVVVAVLLIVFNVRSLYPTWEEVVRNTFFCVTAIISTTGFITDNYDLWPTASKIILMILMFIGGSAGSTAGGLKVMRALILGKVSLRELKLIRSPRAVKSIRCDGKVIEPSVVSGIMAYLTVYIFLMAISVVLVSFDNLTMTESISAVVTCINNVGPGFDSIGAMGNFSSLSNFSKLVLSADMLLGRLELFPILALCSRSLWRV